MQKRRGAPNALLNHFVKARPLKFPITTPLQAIVHYDARERNTLGLHSLWGSSWPDVEATEVGATAAAGLGAAAGMEAAAGLAAGVKEGALIFSLNSRAKGLSLDLTLGLAGLAWLPDSLTAVPAGPGLLQHLTAHLCTWARECCPRLRTETRTVKWHWLLTADHLHLLMGSHDSGA